MNANETNSALLIGYLEEDLPPAEMERVRQMLAADPALMAEFRQLKAQDAFLAGIAEESWRESGLEKVVLLSPREYERRVGSIPASSDDAVAVHDIAPAGGFFAALRRNAIFAVAATLMIATIAGLVAQKNKGAAAKSTPAAPVATVESAAAGLEAGDTVGIGSWIEVADGQSLSLRTAGDSTIKIAGARFRFDSGRNAQQVGGGIEWSIRPGAEPFVVSYEGARIEAAEASFSTRNGRVEVLSGEVVVRSESTGDIRSVRAGESVQLEKGKLTSWKSYKPPRADTAAANDNPGSQTSAAPQAPPKVLFRGSELSAFLPMETTKWIVVNDPKEAVAAATRLLEGQTTPKQADALLAGLRRVALGFRPDNPLPSIVGQMEGAEDRITEFFDAAAQAGRLYSYEPEPTEFGKIYRVRLDLGPEYNRLTSRQYIGADGDVFFFCPTATDLRALSDFRKDNFSESPFYREGSPLVDEGDVVVAIDMPTLVQRFTDFRPGAADTLAMLGLDNVGTAYLQAFNEPAKTLLNGRVSYSGAVGLLAHLTQPEDQKLLEYLPDTSYFVLSGAVSSFEKAWSSYEEMILRTQYGGNEVLFRQHMNSLRTDVGVDFQNDVLPVLGKDAALGFFDADGRPQWVLAAKVADPSKLEQVSRRMPNAQKIGDAENQVYWTPEFSWQIVDGVLLLAGNYRTLNSISSYRGLARAIRNTPLVVEQFRQAREDSTFVYVDLNRVAGDAVKTRGPADDPNAPSAMVMNFSGDRDDLRIVGNMPRQESLLLLGASLLAAPRTYFDTIEDNTELMKRNLADYARLVAQYAAKHSELPPSAEALHAEMTSASFLPRDIFSPTLDWPRASIDRKTRTIKVWSVGPDGRDDKGEDFWDPSRGILSSGDIVVTMNY